MASWSDCRWFLFRDVWMDVVDAGGTALIQLQMIWIDCNVCVVRVISNGNGCIQLLNNYWLCRDREVYFRLHSSTTVGQQHSSERLLIDSILGTIDPWSGWSGWPGSKQSQHLVLSELDLAGNQTLVPMHVSPASSQWRKGAATQSSLAWFRTLSCMMMECGIQCLESRFTIKFFFLLTYHCVL